MLLAPSTLVDLWTLRWDAPCINLEDDAKPVRQMQRRLNPHMKEVVQKEVVKLLDAGIIYPISDSQWVSPVQVIPKKSGITVIKILRVN